MQKIPYKGQELLPLRMDIVFKAVLGKPENKDLLISLLNEMLDMNIKSPEAVELMNTEISPSNKEGKSSRLDIRIKHEDGTQINVEIQLKDKYNMINRSIYYTTKLFVEPIKAGMNYNEVDKTISLSIVNYILLKEEKDYLNRYRLKNTKTNQELTDILELNYLELPKVKGKHKTVRDMWATLIGTEEEEVLEMLANENEIMKKAIHKLKYVSADDQLRYEYDMRLKAEMDEQSIKAKAKSEGIKIGRREGRKEGKEIGRKEGEAIGRQEGKEIGRQEGKEIGRQEGEAIGRQEGKEIGRQEGKEIGRQEGAEETKQKIAKKMIEAGLRKEEIITVTGLRKEEIENLK